MTGLAAWTLALLALTAFDMGCSTYVPAAEWAAYTELYQKFYADATAEHNAQYYYAYNNNLIKNHNTLYERGQKKFKLKINQFTDMRLIHFNAMFPVATPLANSYASPVPVTNPAPLSYDPAKNFGYVFNIEDQGTKCNSGWAYAATKAVEVLQVPQSGVLNPPPLSAQNIIDCAGGAKACTNQVPQSAYDYLTRYDMDLLLESEYPNNKTQEQSGMCLPRPTTTAIKLAQYSTIPNGNDDLLKRCLAAGFAVVVEVNPTSFEFMHYWEGIYEPPRTSTTGSHFMVVLGYDTDANGNDYWILQNSFGTSWGENGVMRLQRSATIKLTNNAIFPSRLG